MRPQQTFWSVTRTSYPAASSTATAAWPTWGENAFVNVSTHRRTGLRGPAAPPRPAALAGFAVSPWTLELPATLARWRVANHWRKLSGANFGRSRRWSMPPRRFASAAAGLTRREAFARRASHGDRVVRAAQRGSQPSE